MGSQTLITAAQMRAVEKAAFESGATTAPALMERAGQTVREAVFQAWPALAALSGRALVLCGPGNNGGDGLVVARLLADWGWEVEVVLYGDLDRLPAAARRACDRWQQMRPLTRRNLESESLFEEALSGSSYDLVVDALFGIGLRRPLQGRLRALVSVVAALRAAGARVVAVDIPSGICADSGRALGQAIAADLTVTFHLPKLGHHLAEGAITSGLVAVRDIGLRRLPSPVEAVERIGPPRFAMLDKEQAAHKFSHGSALVISGPAGRGGAARLAARAALRIGAGVVTVGAPSDAVAEHAARLDAVMLTALDDATDLRKQVADPRITALCLGPGLGAARAQALVPVALVAQRPTVLDADALTAFDGAPEQLFAQLHPRCVLTPHGGEFRRLFPDLAAPLEAAPTQGPAPSKVEAVRAAARRAGCAVLWKGPDSVVALPNGQAALHSASGADAAPWLATAGSGDVLAGLISGLLARGLDVWAALRAALWLHAAAAREKGPGLIAEDLPEAIPAVLSKLSLAD